MKDTVSRLGTPTKIYTYMGYRLFSLENNEKKYVHISRTGKGIRTKYLFSFCLADGATVMDQLAAIRMLRLASKYMNAALDFDTVQVTTKKNPYNNQS